MDIATQFQALLTLHGIASLLMLAVLELVLGIDNIIFISLVIAKLPEGNRLAARIAGLSLAMVMRLFMLWGLVWLAQSTTILWIFSGFNLSIRDVLFFAGGAYLVWSTVTELREFLKNKNNKSKVIPQVHISLFKAITQIVSIDMIFSFDSIFTAIGLIQNFVIMAAAILLGMIFMLWLSGKISAFINKYPTVKILALGFIIAVGMLLISSAIHIELPKKYVYIAFFAAFVMEIVNIQLRKKRAK